jgi:hypothetical protein
MSSSDQRKSTRSVRLRGPLTVYQILRQSIGPAAEGALPFHPRTVLAAAFPDFSRYSSRRTRRRLERAR